MESFLVSRAVVAKQSLAVAASPGGGKGTFRPLFAKQPELTGAPVAAPPSTTEVAVTNAKPHAHAASVEVVRDADGAVQGITVTCKCGERIELECVY